MVYDYLWYIQRPKVSKHQAICQDLNEIFFAVSSQIEFETQRQTIMKIKYLEKNPAIVEDPSRVGPIIEIVAAVSTYACEFNSPRSLEELCRVTIRATLPRTSLQTAVAKLPLPAILKSYLMLDVSPLVIKQLG